MENESTNLSTVHIMASKLMVEFDKASTCTVCSKHRAITVKIDGTEHLVCIGCLYVLDQRIGEFDESTLKDIKKNQK